MQNSMTSYYQDSIHGGSAQSLQMYGSVYSKSSANVPYTNGNHDNKHGVVSNNLNSDSSSKEQETQDETPEIDITISNVVCSYSVKCHLNLKSIAMTGFNVEFRRENAMLTMKLRKPNVTASIWSSGHVTVTGSTSNTEARIAARRVARLLQKMGYKVRMSNYRIVNVLGSCTMPWAIKIQNFSAEYPNQISYEPELHPGATMKLTDPKATLKIFSTGSITVTAPSVENVQRSIEHVYPMVYPYRTERSQHDVDRLNAGLKRKRKISEEESEEEIESEEDDIDTYFK
ncbi:TATA box-binding protein-like 1 isoform X1 [Artemia franciscana]|uniref:TATA box-binding protein-like 1 n=2 Tax=Artemia franciscana TaxID=6661 RepID=A0AA88ICM9_ARTSF|nr:hypothetical protein QYM36_000874 [Artemia franciscana]KAK2724162.1 hypothetical protein QYM36_000874 [Artemia franciscana]